MNTKELCVIAVISNPIGYESRYRLYRNFENHIKQSGAELYTVELAFEDRPFEVTEIGNPNHVQVRTNHILWHKENLINIGIKHLPPECKYVAWIDADLTFINPTWVNDTIQALQTYKVVQMFSVCADLNFSGEPIQLVNSFGSMYVKSKGVIPKVRVNSRTKVVKDNGGIYSGNIFWHPGYAWAARREILEYLGGVMEFPILGSGDHLMALSMVGETDRINNTKLSKGYLREILTWEYNALEVIDGNIGYVPGTIAHHYHGSKKDRGYHTRTAVLVKHEFDPKTDLTKDDQGVLQLVVTSDRQKQLAIALYDYFKSRNEDGK